MRRGDKKRQEEMGEARWQVTKGLEQKLREERRQEVRRGDRRREERRGEERKGVGEDREREE